MATSIKSPYALVGKYRSPFHTWHDLYEFSIDDLEQYSSWSRTRSQHLVNTILDGSSKAQLAPRALQYKLAWEISPIGSNFESLSTCVSACGQALIYSHGLPWPL